MELLTLILIIFVALALLLSCVSFWITIKMMREITALKREVGSLMHEIAESKRKTDLLFYDTLAAREERLKELSIFPPKGN